MAKIFLHGLESSSHGTKGRYFKKFFPDMLVPDLTGPFAERLAKIEKTTANQTNIVMVGSSFGGLLATVYTIMNPARVIRLILLAPALNFPEFTGYGGKTTSVPTWLYIGENDTVTPPSAVVPVAKKVFCNIHLHVSNDDHLLNLTFQTIDWQKLLNLDYS